MRILFDGFWWAEGPVSNRQVMREFVFAWERRFPADEIVVAVPRAAAALARSELAPRVRVMETRVPQHGLSALVEVPFVSRRVRADRTVTHNFSPLFGRPAVFVHDVMFITNPEWFTWAERAYLAFIPASLGRARWILTSTATEAMRISRQLRGHPNVTAVGLGLSPGISGAVPRRPKGLGEVEDFLLAVGRINVRKNLSTAIEAAVRSGTATPQTPLVVVGEPEGRAAGFGPAVTRAVESGAVRFLGFIDDANLAWLYSRARVFLFLSLDEGFGMPTLEALSFGASIVASDIPVFREILGDRATFSDPLDLDAIAASIVVAFAESPPVPIDVTMLGYSWDLSVERMRRLLTDTGQ